MVDSSNSGFDLQAQKVRALGMLAGGIAHDFNNLLQAIVSSLELARRDVAPDGTADRHLVDAMQSAERASELAGRLLAFTRERSGETRVVDAGKEVQGLAPVLQRMVPPSVTFEVVVKEAGLTVEVHPSTLEQVLLNLVTNARDAVGHEGRVTIWCDSVDRRRGRAVRVAVSDDGMGMTADVKNRALEPFFTTKEVGKGTGLGLAIVHDAASRAGGTLRLTSAPDEGTTVEVLLPFCERSVEPVTVEFDSIPATGGGAVILVVDDEPTIRNTLQAALEAEGHKVETARNGGHALAVWRKMQVKPDLLLTDVAMPELDGVELARLLQKKQPGLKVLLMSGYGDRVLARYGEKPEAVGLLDKPFRLATVLHRVADALLN